jgi:hypothetical protein
MYFLSFRFPYVNAAEDMLEEIYLNQNRNRTKPCVQGRSDTFRILQYDINTAAEGSNHTFKNKFLSSVFQWCLSSVMSALYCYRSLYIYQVPES